MSCGACGCSKDYGCQKLTEIGWIRHQFLPARLVDFTRVLIGGRERPPTDTHVGIYKFFLPETTSQAEDGINFEGVMVHQYWIADPSGSGFLCWSFVSPDEIGHSMTEHRYHFDATRLPGLYDTASAGSTDEQRESA